MVLERDGLSSLSLSSSRKDRTSVDEKRMLGQIPTHQIRAIDLWLVVSVGYEYHLFLSAMRSNVAR